MYEKIRDLAPTILIPSAWILTYGATQGYFTDSSVGIAHIIMLSFIAFFVLTGYNRMMSGALLGWLCVLISGFIITLVGTIGFFIDMYGNLPFVTSIFGWMILPSMGLLYTSVKSKDVIYYISFVISTTGSVLFIFLPFIYSIPIVALGQTIGIVKAVLDDKGE